MNNLHLTELVSPLVVQLSSEGEKKAVFSTQSSVQGGTVWLSEHTAPCVVGICQGFARSELGKVVEVLVQL